LLKVGASETLARLLSSAATARVQIADVEFRFSARSGSSPPPGERSVFHASPTLRTGGSTAISMTGGMPG